MSSMYPVNSKFESVDAALNYLREPSSPEVVSSSTTSSTRGSTKVNHGLKSTKKQKKEKETANVMKIAHENTELLSSGRVRYGPITVNPRKQPSKTLFTGRRSKYEQLSNDEEEKRRLRRERNRVAATKCREKREYILTDLETEYNKEQHNYMYLSKMVEQLQQRKQYLLSLVSNQYVNGSVQQINPPTPSQQPSKVFGDSNFLTSMQETSIPLLPPQQIPIRQNEEEEFSGFLQPTSSLTNTAYNNDQTNYIFNTEQQSQQTLTMNSSSLERLISSLQSPTPHIDNNNNTYSGLFNSAYGSSSSCAQQHSSSSEDDSLPPARKNSYVF